MNTIVSFELAKLLKDAGFDIPIQHTVNNKSRVYNTVTGKLSEYVVTNSIKNWNDSKYKELCSAPIIADVVMWLYEKHGIWLSVEQNTYENKFDYLITKRNLNSWFVLDNNQRTLTSPTEAYEAAIEYCLTEIIKL